MRRGTYEFNVPLSEFPDGMLVDVEKGSGIALFSEWESCASLSGDEIKAIKIGWIDVQF